MMPDNQPIAQVLIALEDIPARGHKREIVANAAQCKAVAKRLDVPAIASLEAQVKIMRTGATIQITGNLKSSLTRICVLSLEEMEEHILEAFDLHLIRADEGARILGEEQEDGTIDEEQPEPIFSDEIDLFDTVVQQLSLAMAPYPKKEGAVPVEDTGEQPSLSPFAALASLKEGKSD